MQRRGDNPAWGTGTFVLQFGAIGLACFLCGLASHHQWQVRYDVSMFWPSTGVALAAVFLYGRRMAVAVGVAAFAVGLYAVRDVPGTPLFPLMGFAVGRALESVVGATLLRRVAAFRPQMDRVRDVLALALLGAGLSTLVSAILGPASLYWSGLVPGSALPRVAVEWWLGSALGTLIVAPVVFTWLSAGAEGFERRRATEGVLFLLLVAAASCFGFGLLPSPAPLESLIAYSPLVFPIWAAFRFGPRGASASTLLVTVLAIAGAYPHRLVPGQVEVGDLSSLIAFMVVFCLTSLTLAALIAERHRAETGLREARNRAQAYAAALEAANAALADVNTALRNAHETAESANRAKSEFLANMSHEIRTPMTAMLGFAENLLDDGQTPSDRLDAVHTIRRNGEYLLSIINDILDLSKIEAGKMAVEKVRFSPYALVAEVDTLMCARAQTKGLQCYIEFIGSLPETIETDPTRLRQILVNLLGNAIKFTSAGGVRMVVRLIADPATPQMQFDILDTGIGMTNEQASFVFQAFTQADVSTTREFGGTGLGLTISRRLAQMLGGDLALVETHEGLGTRFRASVAIGSLAGMPLLEPATVIASLRKAVQPAPAPLRLEGRVLLAEDGPDNQRLIAQLLRKAGAEVTTVENGRLAVEAVLSEGGLDRPFDIVLLDMQMPEMDGYEAATILRQRGYVGPIVALTAHAMIGDREKCLQAGCDDYASKPIDRGELLELIHTHLTSR